MALLLTPHKLNSDGIVFESFEVIKSAKSISYDIRELNSSELKRSFGALDKPAKDLLLVFTKGNMADLKARFIALHAKQRAGVAFDVYYKTALLTELHRTVYQLRPFLAAIKCYHKIKDKSGTFRTAPFTFIEQRPVLHFEVTKPAKSLQLKISVSLDNIFYAYEDFNRYQFLLEQNNRYFLLAYKDFQTLEWLANAAVENHAHDVEAFRKHVLSKLELSYRVNRNNLFSSNIIESVPVCQLAVSELSGSFLMLTPQWLYDGIIMEGAFREESDVVRNGNTYLVRRNKTAETEFLDTLKSLHPDFEKQRNGYFFLPFAEAKRKHWFLNAYHQLLELNVSITGMDLLSHFRYSGYKAETSLEMGKGDSANELAIQVCVSFGTEKISNARLKKVILSGQNTFLLKDDSIAVLDEPWLRKYGTLFRHGRLKGEEIRIERWVALTEQNDQEESTLLKPVMNGDWWKDWAKWQREEEIQLYPLPRGIEVRELRPYQQKGYEWLLLLTAAGAGACLADDMGLGKTLQTICFLVNRLELYPGKKQLVVCPSSLMYNWLQEFKKFAPSVRASVYHGNGRRHEMLKEDETDVIITSFGTLRADIEKIAGMHFCVVVVDESHHIKNPSALVTRAVNRLQSVSRVALSGTPVMNNTFDLYSQLNFLLPGMFGSQDFFKQQYADAIDRDNDPVKVKALQKLTAPFILRRTKGQVAADLPEKTEVMLWCEMGSTQMEQYEEIRDRVRNSVFLNIERDGVAGSRLSIIQAITRLRQVCNSPLLLPDEDRTCDHSVKTDVLVDELKSNLKGHKVLVFSQFSKMLDLIAGELEQQGIDFYHFDGQTPSKQRMEMVSAFQEEGNTTNVFLISLMAGNTGLNLTAAEYVILFDPWWNTAVQQQAIDRTHRIGQTKPVFAYKMACRDTIEERIIELQEKKKMLADDLIGGSEGFVKSLSLEDISYLFK